MRPDLAPYLRSLWNVAPPLLDIAEPQQRRPFLSPLGLHLPREAPGDLPHDHWHHAAAAHAAAHLVYSRHRYDPAGLGAIPQALLGLLEDARIEWLASRELPGLKRLWLSLHTTPVDETNGFEALMQRLARVLLDPSHNDPHPWVQKGRQLFFLDDDGQTLALRQPPELRRAASALGHDIGQMRLGFNARLYQAMPSYRDDNSCLWLANDRRADAQHEVDALSVDTGVEATHTPVALPSALQQTCYPEWDRAVPMYRAQWCTVHDAPAPELAVTEAARPRAVSLLAGTRQRLRAQFDGDEFDLDAVVDAAVSQRAGLPPQPRVYQRWARRPAHGTTLLLLDTSASAAPVLDAAREAAWQHVLAIDQTPGDCAIHAFHSDGRQAVHYQRVKDFDEPWSAACLARLQGLRARLSTRLGAALRHATHLLAARRGLLRRLLLITDGRPHDVDVHDPRYLIDDTRQAVREAARVGVTVECLCLDARAMGPLHSVFGVGLRYLSPRR